MTDQPALKSCPFCGGTNLIAGSRGFADSVGGQVEGLAIHCECGAIGAADGTGPHDDETGPCVSQWNRRAPRFTEEQKNALERLIESEHDIGCARMSFQGGRPTASGGYEMKYGNTWYESGPVDRTPECDCGLDEAVAIIRAMLEEDNDIARG